MNQINQMKKGAAENLPRLNPDDIIYRDAESLCSTCAYEKSCMYAGTSPGPVISCEEFAESDMAAVPDYRMKKTPVKRRVDLSLGLCSTCENRFGCTLTRNEGGVWHCEEYR